MSSDTTDFSVPCFPFAWEAVLESPFMKGIRRSWRENILESFGLLWSWGWLRCFLVLWRDLILYISSQKDETLEVTGRRKKWVAWALNCGDAIYHLSHSEHKFSSQNFHSRAWMAFGDSMDVLSIPLETQWMPFCVCSQPENTGSNTTQELQLWDQTPLCREHIPFVGLRICLLS